MIAIVVVSHSARLASGLADLLVQMQPGVPVRAAGGAPGGGIGTNAGKIHRALLEVDNPDGTLVFVDLGSAVMSTEVALERLTPGQRKHVLVSDAPLVEGAVLAVVNASLGLSLAEVAAAAQDARQFPKNVPNAPVEST